ncbi:MAG: hypothetical protein ACP5HM_05565 [Anaerolineae bacterium]
MDLQLISHDVEEETLEAKARWFQSLSLQERTGARNALLFHRFDPEEQSWLP